jgi:hypothetical protein
MPTRARRQAAWFAVPARIAPQLVVSRLDTVGLPINPVKQWLDRELFRETIQARFQTQYAASRAIRSATESRSNWSNRLSEESRIG